MKCIKCATDNNLKDRTANYGKCKNRTCNHPFAFEPTNKLVSDQSKSFFSKSLTDPFFVKAIADLSANNALLFTPKQFLYLLDQRLKPKSIFTNPQFPLLGYTVLSTFSFLFIGNQKSLGDTSYLFAQSLWLGCNLLYIWYLIAVSNNSKLSTEDRGYGAAKLQILGTAIIVIGGIHNFILIKSIILFGFVSVVGLLALWLGLIQKMRINKMPLTFATITFSISKEQMRQWQERWELINGVIYTLLPPPSSLPSASKNELPDADVTNYSFDRVIVCQSVEIAQMLIANNFHFENNCAILSLSGYPQRIFDTTMQMLRRNPDLKVFALHDCSPSGIRLAHQLRTDAKWFPDASIAIIDIGLTPRQIMAAKRTMTIFTNKAMSDASLRLDVSIRQALTPAELQWLDAGNFVELESFTPQKLIHIIQRSIANQASNISDDNLILVGGSSDTYIFATESFG